MRESASPGDFFGRKVGASQVFLRLYRPVVDDEFRQAETGQDMYSSAQFGCGDAHFLCQFVSEEDIVCLMQGTDGRI